MARRKRRRSIGFGAVARSGSQYRGRNLSHRAKVCVEVHRNIGAGSARQYVSAAQPCGGAKRLGRGRYVNATGRTPTAAIKKALHRFATGLK